MNERFFCPCHNGVFAPDGEALEGPPAEAGTDLPRYPLRVTNGLLYIEVPMDKLADARGAPSPGTPDASGHDPRPDPRSDAKA